jgi:RNA-directed DNA polymerase
MPDKADSQERQTTTEKSDRSIVPLKPGNAGGGKGATPTTRSTTTPSARSGGSMVTRRLDRITEKVRTSPKEQLTNLMHHLDVELLTEAFSELEARRAPGVDGVTKGDYGANLQEHLQRTVTIPRTASRG